MEKRPVPAPGYTKISGHRSPPKSMGTNLYVQIRAGHCDPTPWPVATTRWKWQRDEAGNMIEHAGDVVAIRRAE